MKKDWIDKTAAWLTYNRYKVLAIVMVLTAVIWFTGCPAKTISPISGEQVDWQRLELEVIAEKSSLEAAALQLDAEAAKFQAKLMAFEEATEQARVDLERQYEFREQVINVLGEFALGAFSGDINPVNTVGAISLLALGAFGGGTFLDNRRKDKVIAAGKKDK
ncbi:MAG: hypothetical protein GY841_04305 [FCB group bacterium]|nr:hypothetical protein [FCB group bacterium]